MSALRRVDSHLFSDGAFGAFGAVCVQRVLNFNRSTTLGVALMGGQSRVALALQHRISRDV